MQVLFEKRGSDYTSGYFLGPRK